MFLKINKYRNKKVKFNGLTFDSIGEYEYYLHLKTVLKINNIEVHPKTFLSNAKISYSPDFLFYENDKKIYVDFKGFQTPVFRLKRKLWQHYGDGILRLVKKTRSGFILVEEIDPINKTIVKNGKIKKIKA